MPRHRRVVNHLYNRVEIPHTSIQTEEEETVLGSSVQLTLLCNAAICQAYARQTYWPTRTQRRGEAKSALLMQGYLEPFLGRWPNVGQVEVVHESDLFIHIGVRG